MDCKVTRWGGGHFKSVWTFLKSSRFQYCFYILELKAVFKVTRKYTFLDHRAFSVFLLFLKQFLGQSLSARSGVPRRHGQASHLQGAQDHSGLVQGGLQDHLLGTKLYHHAQRLGCLPVFRDCLQEE